jgi:hypothetical protein
MKNYIFTLYLIVSSINSFGQFQNSEVNNKHTLGIGLLPLASSLLIQNTYHIKLNYGYFIKPNIIGYASVFYFNSGKEYHKNTLGVGGDSKFSLIGNQLKIGVRKIVKFQEKKSNDYNSYTFFGGSLGFSGYDIEQDIAIRDFFGNIGYDKKYDKFYSLSFEFQLGLIFKLSNKFNLVPACGLGVAISENKNTINTKSLPDIGFTGRELGPFINFSVDLFYNFNK